VGNEVVSALLKKDEGRVARATRGASEREHASGYENASHRLPTALPRACAAGCVQVREPRVRRHGGDVQLGQRERLVRHGSRRRRWWRSGAWAVGPAAETQREVKGSVLTGRGEGKGASQERCIHTGAQEASTILDEGATDRLGAVFWCGQVQLRIDTYVEEAVRLSLSCSPTVPSLICARAAVYRPYVLWRGVRRLGWRRVGRCGLG